MKLSYIPRISRILFLLLLTCALLISCADNTNEVIPPDTVRQSTNSVFVYNMYGIARYDYDDNGRITEIVTLDPTTLSTFITDTEKYACKYTYGQNGYISELIYFGNTFRINNVDENGRPISAICDTVDPIMTVEFTYGDNDKIIEEVFYEGNELLAKNNFDSDSKPVTLLYNHIGEIKFDYYDTETYITIKYLESDDASPDITLYFDEYGFPRYCTQNVEDAVRATTWSYNQNNLCEGALIESSYDGYFFSEEYMIFHDNAGRISSINLYTPKSDGTPMMSARYEYKYGDDGKAKSQTDTIYVDDSVVSQKIFYEFIDGKRGKITTEDYTDGVLSSKSLEEKAYDAKGRTVKITLSNYRSDGTYSSGKIEEYEYNPDGSVAERVTYSYTDNQSLEYVFTEEFSFNDNGLTTSVIYTAYDKDKQLAEKEIDEFEYNDNNDVTYQTITIYDKNEKLVSKTVTVNEYAEVGYLKATTATQYDSEGNVTLSAETKYNSDGEVISSTSAQYDSDGNVISSTEE